MFLYQKLLKIKNSLLTLPLKAILKDAKEKNKE
jgi:hypothetical protein